MRRSKAFCGWVLTLTGVGVGVCDSVALCGFRRGKAGYLLACGLGRFGRRRDCGARGLCRLVAVLMVGEWGLVTLRIVRGLFGCVVSIVRFLRTFVPFSVFRTVVPFVRVTFWYSIVVLW